jgi:hypothetical protein
MSAGAIEFSFGNWSIDDKTPLGHQFVRGNRVQSQIWNRVQFGQIAYLGEYNLRRGVRNSGL